MTDTEPSHRIAEPRELLLAYLDHYRSTVARKLAGMSETDLRTAWLPSGWTPLELANHLLHMERRWIQWGFAAEAVDEPWGDGDQDDRWVVPADASADDLIASMRRGGERTRALVADASLDDPAALGGRFQSDDERPTLAWTLFHVLQEYARHTGHLDAARELADGAVGE